MGQRHSTGSYLVVQTTSQSYLGQRQEMLHALWFYSVYAIVLSNNFSFGNILCKQDWYTQNAWCKKLILKGCVGEPFKNV